MEYEPVIGLEVHVQLNTATKLFSRVPNQFGQAPNSLTDEVILALPGALPVMNQEAIEKSIMAGLMFDCAIPNVCKWDRKSYFYPDLPKGYQISQFDQPICVGGEVEIELEGPSRNIQGEHRKVKLTRIHLEEDAGKSSHADGCSLVDLNRAGAPLLEIVSEPDIYSEQEAFAFLNSIRIHMLYAGLSNCDMEKGQMRCDANISLRPKGSNTLGQRAEIKNLNSISGVRNAINYEIRRQTKLLNEGKTIEPETRRWDADKNQSFSMRGKEAAHDYRYFPDPDLMPVEISNERIQEGLSRRPERPFEKQIRFQKDYQLPYTITSVLYPSKELSDFFEAALAHHNNPKSIANLLVNDLMRELANAESGRTVPISESPVSPVNLAELVKITDEGQISKQIAQDVLIDMFKTGDDPNAIVDQKGLRQSNNSDELKAICQEVIDNNPKPVQQYKEGKTTAINALKGQVMKATKGQANPAIVDQVLSELLA